MADKIHALAPHCAEKLRLVHEYNASTVAYSNAVTVLQQRMGFLPKTEYETARRAAETARLLCEEARIILESHMAEHGC